jgi:mono/diheme cytochrome c family protein
MTIPFAAAALLLAALGADAATAQDAKETKPALFTADQAGAGAAIYTQTCAACHGGQMEGVSAPALKGPSFAEAANAQSLTAQSLLDTMAASMPESDPGSLKPEEYAAVAAYILQQNGYPAGMAPLASGAAGMKDTKVTP